MGTKDKKALYLDVCTLCRPFDDQSQMRIRLETNAYYLILQAIRNTHYDMLVSAVHFEEVSARVNALLRRSGGWATSQLAAGPVSLDMSRQELKVSDETIELTSFEYKIIEYLMVRAGQVISKAELTDRLYDQDFERDSNVIEVFIGRLRRKMDPDNSIKPIETLRGRGYRFALERNQSPTQ